MQVSVGFPRFGFVTYDHALSRGPDGRSEARVLRSTKIQRLRPCCCFVIQVRSISADFSILFRFQQFILLFTLSLCQPVRRPRLQRWDISRNRLPEMLYDILGIACVLKLFDGNTQTSPRCSLSNHSLGVEYPQRAEHSKWCDEDPSWHDHPFALRRWTLEATVQWKHGSTWEEVSHAVVKTRDKTPSRVVLGDKWGVGGNCDSAISDITCL